MKNKKKIGQASGIMLFISILFLISCSKQNIQVQQKAPGEQTIEGYVVSGGDTTEEGLFDVPRKFLFQVRMADNSIVDVTYTAYPPSPADTEQKMRLSFHAGTILIGDYLKAHGNYDLNANTLLVSKDGDYIETYAKKP